MKGALTPTNAYQFDENGALVANEGESEESRATRESIVLYKEGHSANHPADVAASNGQEIPPEALSMEGPRIISDESEANDPNDPSYHEPTTQEEVEEAVLEEEDEGGTRTTRRGRRGR